jgi:hypothetical protein
MDFTSDETNPVYLSHESMIWADCRQDRSQRVDCFDMLMTSIPKRARDRLGSSALHGVRDMTHFFLHFLH